MISIVAGVIYYSIDGGLTWTAATTASGGAFGWTAIQQERVAAVLNATAIQVDDYDAIDFMNANTYTLAGGAHFVQPTATTGGALKDAGSSGLVYPAGMQPSGNVIPAAVANTQTEAWAVAVRFKLLQALASGSHFLDICGFLNSDGTQSTVSLYGTDSTTVLELIQGATARATANAAGTFGSGLTIGVEYDLLLMWDALNSIMYAQINDTNIITFSGSTHVPALDAVPAFDSNVSNTLQVCKFAWFYKNPL
jgi:hypothetical protein